jgi:hypothetical protein
MRYAIGEFLANAACLIFIIGGLGLAIIVGGMGLILTIGGICSSNASMVFDGISALICGCIFAGMMYLITHLVD